MMRCLKKRLQGPFRALCVFLTLTSSAYAQQLGVPESGVLTISSERLFADSSFGRRVFHEIEAESNTLSAENERIIDGLSAEEKELTEKRSEMSAEEFRPLAEAFEQKVQRHRESQRAKLDALAQRNEEARKIFVQMAQPILIELMRETGASIIIERSNVFLSADSSDITDAAIRRINAAIGDGTALESEGGE